jgi:hypothetical protein
VGLAAAAYQRMLQALLPQGKLWPLVGTSTLSSLLLASADELARVDARVDDLLREAVPATAVEMLPEYEAELELTAAATTAERQANVVARLVARQGFRPVDLQQALAVLLAQDPADVVVLERTHAFALSIGDVREIYRFFVYRNPALPGTYYVASAQALLDEITHSHTIGTVIESVSALYDDPFTLYDRDLLGV